MSEKKKKKPSPRLSETVVFPMRKYSRTIMVGAIGLFAGLIIFAAIFTAAAEEYGTMALILLGLILPVAMWIAMRGNRVVYEISPEGLSRREAKEAPLNMFWWDVDDIGVRTNVDGEWVVTVVDKAGRTIEFDQGVPKVGEAVSLLEEHLVGQEMNELAKKFAADLKKHKLA